MTKAVGSNNLTPFTPYPLFPLSKLERGTGGEVEKPTALVVGDAKKEATQKSERPLIIIKNRITYLVTSTFRITVCLLPVNTTV